MGSAEHRIEQAARGAIGNIDYDQSFNGGYEAFGVNSIAAALRVNQTITHLGLLDVAEAIPELRSYGQFKQESDGLQPLFKLLGPCVVSTGIGGAGVEVSIARTITAPEVERLDGLLATIPDWVYINWGSRGECVTPD